MSESPRKAMVWGLALTLILRALSPAQSATNDPAAGFLTLAGGERFRGRVSAFSQGAIEWTHPDARHPFRFAISNLADVAFTERAEWARTRSRSAVRLQAPDGGEDLLADLGLVRLEGEPAVFASALLDVPFTWPRARLKGIFFPHTSGTPILSGPADTNGWLLATNKPGDLWMTQDGVWISNGRCTLSRALKLTDRMRIDLDLEMPYPLHFKLGFYAQPCLNDFRETVPGYYLECRAYGEVVLFRADAVNRTRTLRASAKCLSRQGRTHYTLCADRALRKFALLANGQPACTWQDEADPPPGGPYLLLMSLGKPQAVAGLTVSEWHGNFDAVGPMPDERTEDTVYLTNGAKVQGRIRSVAEERLCFSATSGPKELDLAHVERIDFASGPTADPRGAAEWRALLLDGSELALTPVSLAAGRMTFALPGGETCATDLANVRRLVHRIPRSE